MRKSFRLYIRELNEDTNDRARFVSHATLDHAENPLRYDRIAAGPNVLRFSSEENGECLARRCEANAETVHLLASNVLSTIAVFLPRVGELNTQSLLRHPLR